MKPITTQELFDGYFIKTYIAKNLPLADGERLVELCDKRDRAAIDYAHSEREIEAILRRGGYLL